MSDKYPITRTVTKIKLKDKNKYLFQYKWNNRKSVTDKKTIQRINKLRIPPAYINVKIYSSPSKIQYTALDDKGRIQKGYHEIWIQERNRKKFRDLIEFLKAYPKIVRKVNVLLPSQGVPRTKEQMVALAVGLLDVCRFRPGSNKHLRDTGSYGTTTLCKKHIKKIVSSGKDYISLIFIGKSGVVNECKLKSNTKISKNIYRLSQKAKSSNSFIFNTSEYKITGNDINNFLRNIGGPNISGKSFRTYHSNIAFIQKILQSLEKDMTEKERKKYVISIIKKSSDELHHGMSAHKNSYLFTPIKTLYIENPVKFKMAFDKKDLNKALASFIRKNTLHYSNVPKNWK